MNKLVKKFGNESRWCNYKMVKLGDRMTKIPYAVTGLKASSTDASTWSTYKDALAASKNIGIIFTPSADLLGIDIDHCLENGEVTHEKKAEIEKLLSEANTYTEVSPSGSGLHLFLSISDAPLLLSANRHAPFEAYTSGRYFTVTQNPYGTEKEIRTVTKKEALALLSIVGYPWKKTEAVEKASAQQGTLDALQTNATAQAITGSKLSDSEVVDKMFKSKGGEKAKALYNGSLADHDNDGSKADMALCAHLAFWTGKDEGQMERIWMASPLGNREKTQKRKDYRNRTISAAVRECKQTYEPRQKIDTSLELLYIFGSKGEKIFLQNTENMCRILRKHEKFNGNFRFDSFKGTYQINVNEKWRTIEDNDAVDIQTAISVLFKEHFGRVGKEMVYDAIIKVCKENTYDSALDYVSSIKWDGVNRLDTWLTSVYGVTDNVYHRAVASNWMKGHVKRIVEPGCKFDYVLVLEGKQGSRKSTSLAILGGDWHVETTMSTESKDFFMQFQGKTIIEFSEGETLSRTEVKRMKAIITMQSDKYRPPYERTSQDFPRRCVFAMTTNQTEYLKDETGNRRWLPVTVVKEEADTEWLKANRDQLFAEAYHRVIVEKETIYEFPKEETLAEQNARRVHDPNTDLIAEWYGIIPKETREAGITIHQVFRDALHNGFASKPMTKYEEMAIAGILDTMGLVSRRAMKDGVRVTRYFPMMTNKMEFSKEILKSW
jgi:primase-polymerase (primpol)-like protein